MNYKFRDTGNLIRSKKERRKGKVVPAYAMEAYTGYGRYTPHFLNLGTRWRRMINNMPQPLYFHERSAVRIE